MGLVGAGPWAGIWHASMIARHPGTTLAAVWARRPEAADLLAREYGASTAATFEDLLAQVDAVAFSVPPDIQADLATRAARAGKHLILEKPLSFSLEDAERLTEAVEDAGVQSVLMVRNRFTDHGRAFVEAAQSSPVRGGIGSFITGAALPGSPFATPWRIQRGGVLDVGPHVLDLMDAAMGRVVRVSATGDPLRWVAMTTEHDTGALGSLAVSITTPGVNNELHGRVFTESGAVVFDGGVADRETGVSGAIMDAFVSAIQTGQAPIVDVQRGLHLQRLIAQVEADLRTA